LLFSRRNRRDVTLRRFLYLVLAIGMCASLFVAIRRERHEHRARTVEIVMDDSDFAQLAQSYGYDQFAFLVALRRAGLTSLAVSEELGTDVGASSGGAVYAGNTLLDQARLTPLADPLFAALIRSHRIRDDEMYLIAYDRPTAARYAQQLPLKFAPRTIRVLRATMPMVWSIKTQADYFGSQAFGLPYDRRALAKLLGLRLVPRLQNDEEFKPEQIAALVRDSTAGQRASTAIFFGLRNEVLGYPNQYAAAATALQARALNFGTVEYYDPKQDQLGNEELAARLPDRIVRVQAIAKPEADKLTPEEVVARYVLGVNERNVRVVYLRPFAHSWNGRSLEATNVEIVKEIARGIRAGGKRLGTASPFDRFIVGPLEIVLVSLAIPAVVLLILAALGFESRAWIAGLILADLVLVGLGYALHHDMLVRKVLALVAGIAFPSVGLLAIGWAFRGDARPAGNAYVRGLIALAVATLVTLGGALVIVGLLSTPLTMTEIDRFSGVKYVLVLPALIGLGLYFFTSRFGAKLDLRTAAESPVRWVQLVVGVVFLAAALLVLERSGNQSDISPSSFELALRAHLTTILQVRPRFKEFLAGFPALMLVPALLPVDRQRWGWLFVLAIGVGLGDLIDTFSHLHTPLLIGVERVFNGAVLGAIAGALAILVYRRLRTR
jgi:hypothetical protein